MKILAVDYFDIVEKGLEDKFRDKQPQEERMRCDNPHKFAEVVMRRYWVDADSELATECMLRGIGTIFELDIIK